MHASAQEALYDTSGITSYGVKVLWLLFTLFIFYGALIPFDFDLFTYPVHIGNAQR